jgi:hypothetical protein
MGIIINEYLVDRFFHVEAWRKAWPKYYKENDIVAKKPKRVFHQKTIKIPTSKYKSLKDLRYQIKSRHLSTHKNGQAIDYGEQVYKAKNGVVIKENCSIYGFRTIQYIQFCK